MYKYLEHEADMGIYAQAESWPEVFSEGARAVFSLMFLIDGRPADAPPLARSGAMAGKQQKTENRKVKIEASAESIEGLFVEWINELLAQKDINSIVFYEFKVDKIDRVGEEYKLVGSASGIHISQYQGEVKTEVKAATYAGLKCGQKDSKYFCQCIVDI